MASPEKEADVLVQKTLPESVDFTRPGHELRAGAFGQGDHGMLAQFQPCPQHRQERVQREGRLRH